MVVILYHIVFLKSFNVLIVLVRSFFVLYLDFGTCYRYGCSLV